MAPFMPVKEFLKLATAQKIDAGAIVNVASIMGVRASAAQAPYAASKHAVVGLTKSIAQDYATMNIRANAIGPGVIDTPMNTELMKDENIMQYMLQRIPMNRVATSDEVANLIYFLASSEASYITGSTTLLMVGILQADIFTNKTALITGAASGIGRRPSIACCKTSNECCLNGP